MERNSGLCPNAQRARLGPGMARFEAESPDGLAPHWSASSQGVLNRVSACPAEHHPFSNRQQLLGLKLLTAKAARDSSGGPRLGGTRGLPRN